MKNARPVIGQISGPIGYEQPWFRIILQRVVLLPKLNSQLPNRKSNILVLLVAALMYCWFLSSSSSSAKTVAGWLQR